MGLVPETAQLLSRLPTHLATDLFASAKPVKLAADQVLFLADDPGDSCYRVEDGLLKVTMVSRSGIERILSFISRGGIVGELAILDGLPRSASVVAVRDTVLSRLSRAEFDAFAEEHPELYKSLITLLTQRLRETNVAVAARELPVAARSRRPYVARTGGSFRAECRIGPHRRSAQDRAERPRGYDWNCPRKLEPYPQGLGTPQNR